MSFGKFIVSVVRNRFLAGVLVIVPLVISIQVLIFLFTTLDGYLSPIIAKYTGYRIPGFGLLITLLLILLVGVIARSVMGARLVKVFEDFLVKLPVIRTVYSPARQLLETFTQQSTSSHNRVALVEYPRKGAWTIGFLSRDVDLSTGGIDGSYKAVFIPSTPTPFTGYVVILPSQDVRLTDIQFEDAVKFLVSGGIACPESMLASAVPVKKEVG
jgi:uncharacterized membrane protein